ncbi:MAG TPA: hypothetical protein DDW54_01465 [Clostridiales bacterium]|nr:hypothetical protein [Clostridiales bacterium]
MNYVLAVFRSRTQVLEFTDYMKAGGVDCKVINTPTEAHVGCGICAAFPYRYLAYARTVVKYYSLFSLTGFYSYSTERGRTAVMKLI